MARSQSWFSGNRLIAIFAIALFAMYLGYSGLWQKPALKDSDKLSGTERDDFIVSATRSCVQRQLGFPENAGLQPATVETYCTCYVNGMADTFTVGELKILADTKQLGSAKARAEQISKVCVARVQ